MTFPPLAAVVREESPASPASGEVTGAAPCFARVALDHPHGDLFDYLCPPTLTVVPGQLVRVPFGRRHVVGLVCEIAAASDVPAARIRPLDAVCAALVPLSRQWLDLIGFAASYYQRGLGEVALPALPQALRDASQWAAWAERRERYRLAVPAATLLEALPARAAALRRLAEALLAAPLSRTAARAAHPRAIAILAEWCERGWVVRERDDGEVAPITIDTGDGAENAAEPASASPLANPAQIKPAPDFPIAARTHGSAPILNDEQRAAVAAIDAAPGFAPFLLFGVTGSGKTEVYLHAIASLLARQPSAQALVLVPEINLTPQLDALFRARFAAQLGDAAIVALHSGLAEGERARNWLAAHSGQARIILGTRLAVLASLPRLALVIVDEEHESAYKQQEGLRYSARDLAVWRAKQCGVPVVLGSATPSLESWWHAERGRYTRLALTRRPQSEAAALPAVEFVDLEAERRRGRASQEGLSQPLIAALRERLARGEQSLVFLNRRGYAPALACDACGWVAGCPRCSAYVVLHKAERLLRCHHCGFSESIPRACPACGNIDLAPLGRGTQRVEEALAEAVPGARVLRIDADSTRRKGSAQALFSDVHAGEVDILIGTHMIAKGHDFQRVTLVGVLNADAALFSHDFRATERLFAQLMQVSGRAGRAGLPGAVMIQTRYAHHPLYTALARHDYAGFAGATLEERRQAHLPPFVHQALLRAEARTLEQALGFLQQAAEAFDALAAVTTSAARVRRYDPVPTTMVKVADTHRAQLLLESESRGALQAVLREWHGALRQLGGVLRWMVEVDPLDI